jgi:hypothetical protein
MRINIRLIGLIHFIRARTAINAAVTVLALIDGQKSEQIPEKVAGSEL